MSQTESRRPVILSMGDPNGVGPEVLLKAVQVALEQLPIQPIIFGSAEYLQELSRDLNLNFDWRAVELIDVGYSPYPPNWGEVSAGAGRIAFESLSRAVQYIREGTIAPLVTAPVSKEALSAVGFQYPGQTEFIASYFAERTSAMAFFSDRLNVVLATSHIPLREVAETLTTQLIETRGYLLYQALRKLGIDSPRIAVCGLNPHASENGMFGDEETRKVTPAIQALNRRCGEASFSGPFPPDTIFRRALSGEFDGIVALYHDQALIPLKLVAFDTAVNVTLGLPVVRCSPDHGTAFEISGKGIARSDSMLAAIQLGLKLSAAVLSDVNSS